jgi:hypothetical protein
MPQSRKRRRDFPFYKIQFFDIKLGTWKDERRTFDTIDEAKKYIERKNFTEDTRIVRIEERSRHVLK